MAIAFKHNSLTVMHDTLPASDKLSGFKRLTFHEPNLIPVRIDIIRALNVFV